MNSVLHPYPADVVLLMNFDGTLTPQAGGAFAADGTSFASAGALWGQSLVVGGTHPGGGGAWCVYSASASAAYDLNATDLTIEGWINQASMPTRPRTLISITDETWAHEYSLFSDGNTVMSWNFLCPSTFNFGAVTRIEDTHVPVVPGAWTHLAMSRQGNTYRAFVNGVMTNAFDDVYRAAAGPKQVIMGSPIRAFVDALDGMIDGVCITKRCLYTASFTPPTGPYILTPEYWPADCHAWPAGANYR